MANHKTIKLKTSTHGNGQMSRTPQPPCWNLVHVSGVLSYKITSPYSLIGVFTIFIVAGVMGVIFKCCRST
jgi:hypothetical protein